MIDPHFDPTSPRHRRPLQAIAKAALNPTDTSIKTISYHLKHKRDAQKFEKDCITELPILVPKGIALEFHIWGERLGGQSFHDRFICFKQGTASFGQGLDDSPQTDDRVNVKLEDEASHALRQKECDPDRSPFDLIHRFTIVGER